MGMNSFKYATNHRLDSEKCVITKFAKKMPITFGRACVYTKQLTS